MKRLIIATALLAGAAATPAGATQPSNPQMPFPAFMNALFGTPPATTTARPATLPSRTQPVATRTTAQPQRADAPIQPSYVTRDVTLPARVVPTATGSRPTYSGLTTTTTSRGTNVAALQPAPRTSTSSRQFDPAFAPKVVSYNGPEAAGTIVINTGERYLYLVQGDGTAKRYGVGVGRPGFEWRGTHSITRKAEWPGWTPPPQMRQRQPGLPAHMEGGPNNPLGARAMYLGSTLYRIHGSNQPWTIGHAVSSGCIRMRNEDVIDLYSRVKVGTTVKVI
jgi:lipoprotein-anchoring transpeptidase ErfK/SrfK